VYDKNDMEASGYAAALADVTQETVHSIAWQERNDLMCCAVLLVMLWRWFMSHKGLILHTTYGTTEKRL
jgi:hypothetical protein